MCYLQNMRLENFKSLMIIKDINYRSILTINLMFIFNYNKIFLEKYKKS